MKTNKFCFSYLSIIVLFFAFQIAKTEENLPLSIGINTSIGNSLHTYEYKNISTQIDFNMFPEYNYQNASGLYSGISIFLNQPISNDFFISYRLGYATINGNSAILNQEDYSSIGPDGKVYNSVTEFRYKTKINSFNTQILVGYNLFDNFNILVGNRLGFVTNTNLLSQLKLITPEEGQFKDDGSGRLDETKRIYTIENGEIQNKNSIESALLFGINYDVNLPFIDDKLYLNTELMSSFNYTSVVNNSSWSITTIYLNLGFKYQL